MHNSRGDLGMNGHSTNPLMTNGMSQNPPTSYSFGLNTQDQADNLSGKRPDPVGYQVS